MCLELNNKDGSFAFAASPCDANGSDVITEVFLTIFSRDISMKKHQIYILLIVVFLFNIVVFDFGFFKSRKMPKDFDYGRWSGSTYKNNFFGFSITFPNDWHIAGEEEIKARVQAVQNEDFVVDKDRMKKIIKSMGITNALLIYAARYTEEEAIEKEVCNLTFGLMVVNLSNDGIKYDLAEYVKAYRQKIGKSISGVTVKSENKKMIGGREFASMKIEFVMHGIPTYQEHLIYVKNDFALVFLVGWLDDSDKEQLDAIMNTLKWE